MKGPRGAAPVQLPFEDRPAAGRMLAGRLRHLAGEGTLVLALPRGGVPVGFEVARALEAPLDLVLVRKIGAPGHEELGLGAVVDGAQPHLFLNPEVMRSVRPDPGYVEAEERRQLAEIERRRRRYRGGRPPPAIAGRTVIVVDDGIATGGTARAALEALRLQKPARLVLAVPVAPADTLATLAPLVDETVCLAAPEPFYAVGAYYREFAQTTDEEVVALLDASARGR
jgi:putative phosphoribosyl transferase